MKCQYCGSVRSKVIDSRQNEDGTSIRRRRECEDCGKRFTTYEVIESTPIYVIKKDGSRQAFDEKKIKAGLMKACEKRPVSAETINDMMARVTQKVNKTESGEVSSEDIGEWVMEELKNVDEVAYVRFASVHRQFKDISTFLMEIEKLIKNNKHSDK